MSMRMWSVVLAMGLGAAVVGCHADEDDAEGQAEELSDPVRRANAISNLQRIYANTLAENGGDRSAPEVKEVADAIHDELTQTYVEHPEDTQNGQEILDLLKEMRDPRTTPALVKALDWRTEVSEEHAIRAAQAIRKMEIPEGDKGEVIEALSNAIEKIDGSRPVDNRMRVEFLRALGNLEDRRATSVLVKVMTNQSEDQDFLMNRLAARELGALGDPEAVPDLIRALFLFDPNNPAVRMNDVAAEALVRIGRPAFDPLVKVLKGKHEAANEIAKAYIEAVKGRNARAAAQMDVDMVTSSEATFALGALGFREALDPLLAQTKVDDINRRTNAAIALVRLNHNPEDLGRVRDALKSVYDDVDPQAKPQLIAASRHLYDREMLPFFLKQASDGDSHPVVRLEAVKAYALLADKGEAKELRSLIKKEKSSDDGGYREKFKEMDPALEAAESCDRDVGCWIGKLEDDEKLVQRKAAYMLGRLARGEDKAIDALVDKLSSPEIKVRLAAVAALDRIAVEGSQKAVEKIEELRETESGRSIWTEFAREALPIQARLRGRA
ncbi:MAG: HEAT repeat domain-containing protein [Myxococcota bacterium]